MQKLSPFLSRLLPAAALTLCLCDIAAAAAPARVDALQVPGEPLVSFDIGIVTDSGLYALADRSNRAVDLFEAATGKFVGRVGGFTGFDKATGSAVSGPDGVVAVGGAQPAWEPETGKIYLSIPVLDGIDANGAVAVFDPHTLKLAKLLPVSKCMPAGLAVGPHGRLLLGCSDDAVDSGFPAQSLIMDAHTGRIVATIDKVGGSDEVWYDSKSSNYYLAAAKNPGGPVLGVVNAQTNQWIANLPSGPRAHSVAADPKSGRILVPIEASKDTKDCSSGCIAVYAGAGN